MSLSNAYQAFSRFYDRLMQDVDYAARAEYLLSLFHKHGCATDTLLDLACGSGNISIELAGRGVDVIGVDGSEEMLSLARMKAAEAGHSILFLQQDMRQLDLYGTVNGAVCTLDSLNHLLTTAHVRQVFDRLYLFIEPGGLLIFDVNTPYKHREILGNNAFVFELPELMCVWRNRLNPKTCQVDMLLDFFEQIRHNRYDRYTDLVRERAYSEKTLRKLLSQAGFETEAVYGDMTLEPPADTEQRMVFVARRKIS